MKKKLIGLGMVVVFLLCGCASMSQTTDDYIVNIEIAKENAVKIATISEFKTCFIRACLGGHIDKLPYEMVITLGAIDELLKEIGVDYDAMTDCQKGQILGLWTRLGTLGFLEIVEEINPGVLADLL